MKAKITAMNKEYLGEFKNDDQFISFMTTHNDKINNIEIINENELPATSKSVEMVKISKPTGWNTLEKSAFVTKEKGVEKKGMTLGGKYGEFKYDSGKTLEASTTDKVSDTETESPVFKGSEPKASSVEDKQETPKTSFKKSEPKEESKETTEESDEDKKEDLEEGFLDTLKSGYNKLKGAPQEQEIPELVNEFLVYAFMDITNKVSFEENDTYQRIAKLLTKADKKFANFVQVVRRYIANRTIHFDMPLNLVEDLAEKLVKMGVDRQIVERAKETFMREEMNSDENVSEAIEKPSMDDVDFEDDLTDADKEMYTSEVQHILDIWDELSAEEQKELKRLMFNKSEKETLNEKGCLEEFNHPMINNGAAQQSSNDNEFQVNVGDTFLDNNGNEITVQEIGDEQVDDNVGGKGRLVKLTNAGGENIQMPSSVLYNNYKRKEDGLTESEEDFEQYETCSWCNEKFPKSDLKKEKDMGYVCHQCRKGIESREGDLDWED
jgi:hypothetical protein